MAVRCPFGYPAVVETRPYLEDGTPFPTLFYLTCPSAVASIDRLEERGGVEAFRRRVQQDPAVGHALATLTDSYARRRRALAADPPHADDGAVLDRGIGGPEAGRATCLHAQAAALLAALAAGPAGDGAAAGPEDRAAGGSEGDATVWRGLLDGFGDLWCGDQRCASFGSPGVLRAAIDVGTNSVRLLVARITATGVQTLMRRAEVTRLGEGLAAEPAAGAERTLDEAARTRTAAVVERYVEEARRCGVDVVRLVGTSACRQAADGPSFIAELGRRHRVEASVVSGELEAALAYAGATMDVRGSVVLLDVGGGSTELVARQGGAGAPALVGGPCLAGGSSPGVGPLPVDSPSGLRAVSLPIGCVTGAERWFSQDPPIAAERAAARAEVAAAAAPYRDVYGPSVASQDSTLVGVAGTVTTLACLALGLEAYDPEAIHLQALSLTVLAAQHERLAAMDVHRRTALPCMQKGRAEVIVAGGEILLGVMEALGWNQLVVSERDILDGIVSVDSFAEMT